MKKKIYIYNIGWRRTRKHFCQTRIGVSAYGQTSPQNHRFRVRTAQQLVAMLNVSTKRRVLCVLHGKGAFITCLFTDGGLPAVLLQHSYEDCYLKKNSTTAN